MNTKVIPVIAVVVAISLVAVGVGYAYNASVSTGDNDVTTKYMIVETLDSSGDARYSATLQSSGLQLDTINSGGNITYILSSANGSKYINTSTKQIVAATGENVTTVYKIGTQDIKLTRENIADDENTNVYVKVSITNEESPVASGFAIYYSVGEDTGSKAAAIGTSLGATTMAFTNGESSQTITLYAAITGTISNDGADMLILDDADFNIIASTETIN